ncbi:MAG TPA: hypothetical protein VMX94_02335 [Armatimonadota bacterium]|nr:hypothetical protein [Armatimonadota bacterium]
MLIRRAKAVLLFALAGMALPALGDSTEIKIATQPGPKARIVVTSKDPLMQRTGAWCRDFLAKRGLAVEPETFRDLGKGNSPAWILEVKGDCPIAHSLGINTAPLDAARADAFILTVSKKGSRPVVSVVGRNVQGVRSGVVRLVAITAHHGEYLSAPKTSEFRTPFFPVRRITICPTGRIAQYDAADKPWVDTLSTRWSDERIRRYAEQLWLFGFNSVELCELRGYRATYTDEQLKKEVTPKLRVFMKAVRDNGMEVSQFIWGQNLFAEGASLCWNSPEERPVMEKEFRRLAQTYGDLVDHIVVHVGDPGGCDRNGCDPYKTTQEIATGLLNEYRKVNPNVTVTLSTWANFGFWDGAPGVKFLDESYSPKEIGIALHRWYYPDKAKLVRDSGRDVDIWSWYMSDFELQLNMSLFMRRVNKYFAALPDRASKDIRAISTEICFHGWPQIINAYVSAQKMWSPRRSLQDIESEFCAGTFGDKNADAMVQVYQTCEKRVRPDCYFAFTPTWDHARVVLGTPQFSRQCRAALEAGEAVTLDPNRPPRFTSATDPQALKDYLMRSLNLISIFSEAQEKVKRARSAGASQEELRKIVDDAESRAQPFKIDPDYRHLSAELKKRITEKAR